jgi:hypothetical protein
MFDHITQAQAFLASLILTDSCVVTRGNTSGRVMDPTTLELTSPSPLTVFSGACLVSKGGSESESTGVHGGQDFTEESVRLRLPAASTEPLPGDLVTITASNDSALVGSAFVVTGAATHTMSVSRMVYAKRLLDLP